MKGTAGMAEMKTDISGVVESTVVETFNGMLGQNVVATAAKGGAGQASQEHVYACLLLDQKQGASANFCFTFDDRLLARTAAAFYPPGMAQEKNVREDIACAVANIVGSRVKTCLNKYGHSFDMAVPFVAGSAALARIAREDVVHLHFSWNDGQRPAGDGVTVDFGMDERPAGNC